MLAQIAAIVANAAKGKKGKRAKPIDFMPWEKEKALIRDLDEQFRYLIAVTGAVEKKP